MPNLAKASAVIAGLVLALAGPAAAAPGEEAGRKLAGPKASIFTDGERAVVAARCGYGAEWNGRNVVMNDGVLICSNGRRVNDPEVRAITARVGERVRVRVREAIDQAQVARTISRRAREQVRERMRHLHVQRPHLGRAGRHARLHLRQAQRPTVIVSQRLGAEERAQLHAELAQMRAEMRQMRETIRRDVLESLRREGVH